MHPPPPPLPSRLLTFAFNRLRTRNQSRGRRRRPVTKQKFRRPCISLLIGQWRRHIPALIDPALLRAPTLCLPSWRILRPLDVPTISSPYCCCIARSGKSAMATVSVPGVRHVLPARSGWSGGAWCGGRGYRKFAALAHELDELVQVYPAASVLVSVFDQFGHVVSLSMCGWISIDDTRQRRRRGGDSIVPLINISSITGTPENMSLQTNFCSRGT